MWGVDQRGGDKIFSLSALIMRIMPNVKSGTPQLFTERVVSKMIGMHFRIFSRENTLRDLSESFALKNLTLILYRNMNVYIVFENVCSVMSQEKQKRKN